MKNNNLIDRYGQQTLTVLFAVAVFFIWQMRLPFLMLAREQSQLFLWNGEYFMERLLVPGGFAQYLSEFIVQCLSGESNLNRMAIDIIQEVSKTVFEEHSMESQGLRNVAKFLIFLSERASKIIYNNITTLLQFFDCNRPRNLNYIF